MINMTSRPLPQRAVKIAASLAFVALAGAASTLSAAPSDEAPQLTVRYAAESLTTESGTRALYRRLVNAAVQVCPATTSDQPFVNNAVSICRQQALARAVHDIGNVRLAALHAASSKRG